MKNLLWTETFTRKFKRLVRQNPQLKILIEQRLQQLSENPFHPSLRTHKLKLESFLGFTIQCSKLQPKPDFIPVYPEVVERMRKG